MPNPRALNVCMSVCLSVCRCFFIWPHAHVSLHTSQHLKKVKGFSAQAAAADVRWWKAPPVWKKWNQMVPTHTHTYLRGLARNEFADEPQLKSGWATHKLQQDATVREWKTAVTFFCLQYNATMLNYTHTYQTTLLRSSLSSEHSVLWFANQC